ncbi:MAG: T9SS type A sorting domain-containing protein [Bacteroidia bacterium]
MKKILLLFAVTTFSTVIVNAQCTPDNNIRTTGIFPALLDTGNINQPYNQVIQYFITRDTVVNFGGSNINAIIDSITITGVKGMPTGLSYTCHNATCTSPGGQTGCVTLSGTPTQSGIFPITVYLTIRARAFLGPVPIGQTVSDSNSRYFIAIKPITTTSLSAATLNDKLFVYQQDELLNVFLTHNDPITSCVLKDLSGKTIANTSQFNGNEFNRLSINIGNLTKGIYFLEVGSNQGFGFKKFIIR